MPGARCTRSLVCAGVTSMHTSIHSEPPGKHPTFPHAMVLTAYTALSPVIGFLVNRHLRKTGASAPGWADLPSANLTPASRRQDHTSSPSASAPFVSTPFGRSRAHKCTRPAITFAPNAAASTASHPASQTIRIRPSGGRDGVDIFQGD
jgi:hypothetical protein